MVARELAVSFAEPAPVFVSEASVYRLLKAPDVITSPAFILMKAADTFAHGTTAPNQLRQTDLPTCGSLAGEGSIYRPCSMTSRYILA
jgi:putative transposase